MLPFPSDDGELSSHNKCALDSSEVAHTRVNSSPTRPRDVTHWPSKGTPSRPRPHLRSLDLASVSPPATPSYLSSTFLLAPKSAGRIRTVAAHGTSYPASPSTSVSLAALNLNPSSTNDSTGDTQRGSDNTYVDLNDSPTLKSRPLSFARLPASPSVVNTASPVSSPVKLRATSFLPSTHRRTFIPHSPVRATGQGPATPPLTPSSSFASADTSRSERDEHDSEIEDGVAWYDTRRVEPQAVVHPGGITELDSFEHENSMYYMAGMHANPLVRSTSPAGKTNHSLPAPDSPTPVRGRKSELASDISHRRSTSASSAECNMSPRHASPSPSPAHIITTNDSLLLWDAGKMPTFSPPPSPDRQRSSSADPRARHGKPPLEVRLNMCPPSTTHSVTARTGHDHFNITVKSDAPPFTLQNPYYHEPQSHMDQYAGLYGYQYLANPPFEHYGVAHRPAQFGHMHGLLSPNHISHGPPPSSMGHPAFDSALANAYATQAQIQGPPTTALVTVRAAEAYETAAAPLWLAPQAAAEPTRHSDTSNFVNATTHTPPSSHVNRSSMLYTNRSGYRGNQRGSKGDYGARRNHQGHAGRNSPSSSSSCTSPTTTSPGAMFSYAPQVPDKNQLDIEAIASGADTRTTVMIKNIPNKMSDKDLLWFINRVCPRRIDFFYLRMDFGNGCNVGYAFVNFILPEDLLHFAKTQLGVRWNMYSSEKVLQLSYANYQGKEALVEKFKNSGIMDVRPEWRPRIFHSVPGPLQGCPEPFPAPTHLRRKERSANNRGALFVPGPAATGGPRPHYYGGPTMVCGWTLGRGPRQ